MRESSSPADSVRKIEGLRRFYDITLKRGIVKGGNEFFNCINTKHIGRIERRNVTISLPAEAHEPVVWYRANNAFPLKQEGAAMESMGSDVATQALILTHEGITVKSF